MSDTEAPPPNGSPAEPTPPPGTDVVLSSHVTGPPSPAEWSALKEQASWLAASTLVAGAFRQKEANVMLVVLQGRELELPPVMAMTNIHVIDGKPSLSAKLQMALILRAGHEVWYDEESDEGATVCGRRRGETRVHRKTFTMADAEQAGLATKDNWKHYPRRMLKARALTELTNDVFPDVLMGCTYSPEELGADVDPMTGDPVGPIFDTKVDDDDAQALLERVDALTEASRGALVGRFKELGIVIARRDRETREIIEVVLPAARRQEASDEIAAFEQAEFDAGERAEPPAEPVVEATVETEPDAPVDEADTDDVDEAEVVEDAPAEGRARPQAEDGGVDNEAEGEAVADAAEAPAAEPTATAPDAEAGPADSPAPAPAADPSSPGERSRVAVLMGQAFPQSKELAAEARHALADVLSAGRTRSTTELTQPEIMLAIKVGKAFTGGHIGFGVLDDTGAAQELPVGEVPPEGAIPTLVGHDEDGAALIDQLAEALGAATTEAQS